MTLRLIPILCLLAFPDLSLQAQQPEAMPDPAPFLQKLEAAAEFTNSIQASFSQEKHLSFLESPMMASGRFYFQRSNKVRWAYEKPFPYLIVLAGGQVSLVDGDKVSRFNASENRMFSQINDLILLLVKGQLPPEDDFERRYFQTGDQYILELYTRSSNLSQFLDRVTLHFNKANMTVDEVIMTEPSGDFTRITFDEKKINATLDQSLFSVQK